jgi:para-aminobenzoate synthetase / 4-amino-4-deoxychorismate lyase
VSEAVILAGGRWQIEARRFARPSRIIAAREVSEVLPALQSAEIAARNGSWVVGFVSYQAAPGLDSRLRVPAPGVSEELPLVWFGVFDGHEDPELATGQVALSGWSAGMSETEHASRVESIRASIAEGDTYQVNLTFPMEARLSGSPETLFSAMLRAQPQCYGAFFDLGERQILSVSPELFLRQQGRSVTTQPMKGTAPRGRWTAEDMEMRQRLTHSEKERAGNLMIVDMLRNDLGRVARSGTVRVPELIQAERHPTVWQLTSTIEAELEPGIGLAELFTAVFPCGSVTGAPKISTMGIISELEVTPRGVYCGAIGYLAPGGISSEFSVAIRTGVAEDTGFRYHVGGGITYDSVAGTEYDECLLKALVVTDYRQPPDLLETMRYVPGEGIPLLQEHIARLAGSAGYWGIDLDPARVGEALSAVEPTVDSRVRLVLAGDGSIEVRVEPIPVWDEPVALTVSDVRVDQSDPLWYHKTVDRSRYPLTDDVSEALLVNLDGEVTETNRSNLMAHLDGGWVTPPVSSGLLPGVARALAMVERGVTERALTVDDLRAADELAVTNALRGWRKATLIG